MARQRVVNQTYSGDGRAKGKPTPEAVLKRVEAANAKWDMWRGLYESCYRFAAPQRNMFTGAAEYGSQGSINMNNVFDSTAISSLDRFANRVQANVFPPQKKWARLEPGTAIAEDRVAETRMALEKVNDDMFAVMRSSNFDIAIGEFLIDLGIGTACMCVQPGDAANPVNYIAVSPAVVRFEEDEYGRPCNVFRTMKVKAELIETLWKGAKLTDDLRSAISERPQEEIEFTESTMRDLNTYRYHYQIIYNKGKHEVYHRNQKYSNWIIARYSKMAGEVLGRGPVTKALPDIRTLNKTKEYILKNAALAMSGVWTGVDDGVMNPNNVKFVPGTVIPVAANSGPRGPTLQSLKPGGDFNVSQLIVQDLVMAIKRTLLDESLPPDTASARSATEIIERMKELAQNMGSAFGRLIDEVLLPIVDVTLAVLNERGVVLFPLKLDGREVKSVSVSPLAMAQNMDEVEAIINFGMMAAQFGPEGQAALNKHATIDHVGDMMGVPAKVRNNRQEREAEMARVAEAQQAAAQAAVAAEVATNVKPVAPAAPMGLALAA